MRRLVIGCDDIHAYPDEGYVCDNEYLEDVFGDHGVLWGKYELVGTAVDLRQLRLDKSLRAELLFEVRVTYRLRRLPGRRVSGIVRVLVRTSDIVDKFFLKPPKNRRLRRRRAVGGSGKCKGNRHRWRRFINGRKLTGCLAERRPLPAILARFQNAILPSIPIRFQRSAPPLLREG